MFNHSKPGLTPSSKNTRHSSQAGGQSKSKYSEPGTHKTSGLTAYKQQSFINYAYNAKRNYPVRCVSSQEVKTEFKRREEMTISVRAGIKKHLAQWGKEKAKRESERIASLERNSLPSVFAQNGGGFRVMHPPRPETLSST